MPSTTSSWVSMVLDSSTVMTPSLPTFFMASAMMRPMVSSLFAEMVPTCAIISPETGFDSLSRSLLALAFLGDLAGHEVDGLLDAALQSHGIGAGGNRLHAFAIDGLRKN